MRRIVPLLMAAAVLLAPANAGARGLVTGFADPLYTSPDASERASVLDATVAEAAEMVRIDVSWRLIAPSPPTVPTDPGDPAYRFATLDAAVHDASARGLAVLLTVSGAPDWAEGPNRAADAPPGTWMPDAAKFGAFATALATRYSGSYAGLPGVRLYQAWNEPNLYTYLNPQYEGQTLRSASLYRTMLNAFYGAVHAVRGDNVVVSAGTGPFGDPPGGRRTRPLEFLRALLCLQKVGKRQAVKGEEPRAKLAPTECETPAKLDVLAHHPINTVGGPHRSAINPDDAITPDLGNVRDLLRAAERFGSISPPGHRPLWVTEFWWETNPPDPSSPVGLATQARWIQQALYLAWKQGASAALAFQVRDSPLASGLYQSGFQFASGSPKPSFLAFRFPFVTDHKRGGATIVWGRSPLAGRLRIQRRAGHRWQTLRTLKVVMGGVFNTRVRLPGKATLRAQVAGESSLSSPG
jgi:hypothetical protein